MSVDVAAVAIEGGAGWMALGVPSSSGRRSFRSGMRRSCLCRPEWMEDRGGMMVPAIDLHGQWRHVLREGRRDVVACLCRP